MARNVVFVEGKLTKYSLVKTKSGKRVAKITLACYNGGGDGGPAYFNADLWNPSGDVRKFLKGAAGERRVVVSGQLRQNKWEDDNGTKRYDVRINADAVYPAFELPDNDDNDNEKGRQKGGKKKFKKNFKKKESSKRQDDDDDDNDDSDDGDDDDDDDDVPF